MPLDGTVQYHGLELAADDSEILGRLGVIDTFHFLLDDRAFVQVRGYIVSSGTDQLHAARESLLIRLRALEAGQEGMVNVDGAPREVTARLGSQNLHVAGEHHQLRVRALE